MWKKGLYAFLFALGLAMAVLIIRPAIAVSAVAPGGQASDDRRISAPKQNGLAAAYAHKVAMDDQGLAQLSGPVTAQTPNYAGIAATDDRGRLLVGVQERSSATAYAEKVAGG
ncbi:MAG: hypothetical protein ABSF61_07805 [Anaerolineales bacterium]|jgi:hypothetical protein